MENVANSEIMLGVGLTLWVFKELAKVLKPYVLKKKDKDDSVLNEIKRTNEILLQMGKKHAELQKNQYEQMELLKDIKRLSEKDHHRIDELRTHTGMIAQATTVDSNENSKAHTKMDKDLTDIRVQLAGGK